jgi:hypothetical protein
MVSRFSKAQTIIIIFTVVLPSCAAWITSMCQSPHRLPAGLQGNPNYLNSLSMNRRFAGYRSNLISIHMNDGKLKSEEKLSPSLDDISATYEGTGGFVKGLVSVLTDMVNLVMARSAQVCTSAQ